MSNAPHFDIDVARFWADPYPDAGEDAEGGADRVRAAARLHGVHPARRHLHPGKAHRRVLLASAGRADEHADGPQHDAQGRRCAHGRARGDVSLGVAAHRARHLEPAVSGPCRPHPRRAGAGRARRSLQGVRAAAVGRVPEGRHRADQHALCGHGRVVAGDDRRHRQLHRQQGSRGALPCRHRRHRCRDRRHDPGGDETSQHLDPQRAAGGRPADATASAPTSSLRSRAGRTSRATPSPARSGRC